MFVRNHKKHCSAAAVVGFLIAFGVSVCVACKLLSENSSLKAKLKSFLKRDDTYDDPEDWVCYCDDSDYDDDDEDFDEDFEEDDDEIDEDTDNPELTNENESDIEDEE
ncbi:MAG TPA: hypothetical protein GXX17_05550 [Clostridiales bacterium]|nr:hypothetical protein [Clostridiales bacterium]